MVKLLMVADDFTGALDTGVHFAARGARTCVVTDPTYDFTQVNSGVQVLVLDAETRHLSPQMAYDTVYRAVRNARAADFNYIYKKTDSGLRGNVGAELAAVLDATGADHLAFLPAFPKMNRVTRNGVHYIDGVPVAESVFGQDPFEPVTASSVSEIIGTQTEKPVVLYPLGGDVDAGPGIHVYDAETDRDLEAIGQRLGKENLVLSAGCAGFASVLADLLELEGTPPGLPYLTPSLFIACGSVNPVTLRQMDAAENAGFSRIHLNPVQKLEPVWRNSQECNDAIGSWLKIAERENRFILDVNDPEDCDDTTSYAKAHGLTTEDLRQRISNQLGHLVKRMLDGGLDATLLCTGGDTLLALTRTVDVAELIPVCELDAGVVLTDFVYQEKVYHIISKSGGFGGPDLFIRLARSLGAENKKEDTVC